QRDSTAVMISSTPMNGYRIALRTHQLALRLHTDRQTWRTPSARTPSEWKQRTDSTAGRLPQNRMDWGLDGTRIGENFIGWTAAQRQARLYLILNNRASRFRPGCASQPASRVLAVATRRLTEDWHQRYG